MNNRQYKISKYLFFEKGQFLKLLTPWILEDYKFLIIIIFIYQMVT